jgi:hypothetical protein
LRRLPLTFPKELVYRGAFRMLMLGCWRPDGGCRSSVLSFMSQQSSFSANDPRPDHEQKQAALSYLNEAWAEARHDGVDGDCLAQASLFAAFAELVGTYGEDAVAKFVEGLANRVRNGEFSLALARQ